MDKNYEIYSRATEEKDKIQRKIRQARQGGKSNHKVVGKPLGDSRGNQF